ncbi:hypothetical protein Tco_1420400 [Tanacetum coccineum]
MQQTPVPTPATALSYSLQDLPNFGSLFGFDHRLKTLETDFSELKQTNQFATAVSSIPGVVYAYLSNKMHEAVKTDVQLQSDRLRDEAQAENADFINKLDDNIKKIIKDQVKEQVKAQVSKILPKIKKTVNEQLEAEVLTRSSNESKTSHAVAANLSELELKKILIDKMESNKSIHRSDEQKNLYKALVDAYESDKLILDTYGETVSFKRRRDEEDKDEEPSAGSNRGSKRRRAGKEPESTSAPKEKTLPMQRSQVTLLKTQACNKIKSSSRETMMNNPLTRRLPKLTGSRNPSDLQLLILIRFNDTSFDFSAFVLNRLKIPNLTQEILVGPAFNLLKGTCKSITELEYHLEECSKATTERLDWHNPKNKPYPFDLRKPLSLIQDHQGRQIIPKDYFINKDLEYLKGGDLSRRYSTSVTKTKAATYELKWIEDLVPEL